MICRRPIAQKEPRIKVKQKKCKQCKAEFVPQRTAQVVCSPLCGIRWALGVKAKKQSQEDTRKRVEYRAAKEQQKSRADWLREVQQVFNQFVRKRDKDQGCISCEKPATWQGQWHASHFYATSIRPNLRFNENNVHKACSVCNNYMHGNLTPYREKLIKKIGIEEMNILDADIAPAKLTIQDLKDLKAKYAKLIKELKNQMQD